MASIEFCVGAIAHLNAAKSPSTVRKRILRKVRNLDLVVICGTAEHFGLASPNSKPSLSWVRMLVWFYLGWCYVLARQVTPRPIETEKPPVRCSEMQLVAITDGSGRLLYNHPLSYLDSS